MIDVAFPLSIRRRQRCARTSALIKVSSGRGFDVGIAAPSGVMISFRPPRRCRRIDWQTADVVDFYASLKPAHLGWLPLPKELIRNVVFLPRCAKMKIVKGPVGKSLELGAMPEPAFDPPFAAVALDRETLLTRFDGIRQFARGGRRAPHKPLLLLYALAGLKHDRQTEVRFNATEAIVNPLLRSYGPWGSGALSRYGLFVSSPRALPVSTSGSWLR